MRSFPAIFLLLLMAGVVRAEDHEVRIDRPLVVGQSYREQSRVTNHQSMILSVRGREQQPRETVDVYAMDAQVQVLAVSGSGGATQVKLTIHHLTRRALGVDQALAANGDVITAVHGKENEGIQFQIAQGKLSDEALKALRALVSLDVEGTPTFDELYPTKDRHEVGAHWPIDPQVAVDGLKAVGMTGKKEKTTGQATLVSHQVREGVPCLEVACEMEASDVTPPASTPLPAGAKLKEAVITLKSTGLLPTDGSPPVASSSDMKTQMLIEVPGEGNRPGMQMQITIHKTRSSTYKY